MKSARPALLPLGLFVALCGCQPTPKPDSAFQGEPVATRSCPDELVVHTLVQGQGPAAGYGDLAKVHYVAKVKGGHELARSHDRQAPYLLVGRKGELVEGLHRGLVGMKVGELRKILVPPDLGYRGRKVPGVQSEDTLEFWVELFALTPGAKVTPPDTLCPS